MLQIDDSKLLAGLDRLLAHIPAQAEHGLAKQAELAESEMHATSAHGDVTSATRASYRAFVIGGAQTGDGAAASGYAAAQAAIASATGKRSGHALSQDSGVALDADDRGVLLTSYTDYQDKLEVEHAGAKAVLAPTLQQHAQQFTQAVAREGL